MVAVRLLIFLLLLSAAVNAQELAEASPATNRPPTTQVGIHLTPLSLTGIRPRLRVGGLIRHHDLTFLIDLEYGGGSMPRVYGLQKPADIFYGIRPEVRYGPDALASGSPYGGGGYLGLEVPITYTERTLVDGTFGGRESDEFFDYDQALRQRKRASAIAKVGYLCFLNGHMYLDGYVGAGYGINRITYVEVDNQHPTASELKAQWALSNDDKFAGRRQVIELALGFRVGYAF